MKLDHLESLRGLAAVAVVFAHLVWAFANPPKPANDRRQEWPAGAAVLSEPGRTLAKVAYWPVKQGRLAVYVFFALSGVVLSQSYLARGRVADLQSATLRRYLRLAGPAVVASLLAWALFKGGFRHTEAAADVLRQAGVPTAWLDMVRRDAVSGQQAVREAAFDLYFRPAPTPPAALHNPALWTMRVEFHGSLVVFAFLAVFGPHPRRLLFALAGALLLAGLGLVELGLFLAGVTIAAVRQTPHRPWPVWAGLLAALGGLALGGWFGGYDGKPFVVPNFEMTFKPGELKCAAGAVLLVGAVTLSPGLGRVLRWRPLVWLGGVSFGIYLVHMPVLFTAGAWTVARLTPTHGWPLALLAASGVTLGLSLAGGWVMTALVDRPTVWAGKKLARALLGPPARLDAAAGSGYDTAGPNPLAA